MQPLSSSNLFSLARSKLHLSVGSSKDSSLHRWVLLKNSIIKSPQSHFSDPPVLKNEPLPGYDEDYDEQDTEDDHDSFMFPDAGKLGGGRMTDSAASEAEWLDSLLETLGDEDDDYSLDSETSLSATQVDDDDDMLLSPVGSPMSSSDDLVHQPHSLYYPPPLEDSYRYPYPVPYPPFHPPLIRTYELGPIYSPLDHAFSPPFAALPYYDDIDDVEDLAVPEAIEDTSDDESDVPPTPSLTHASSLLSLVDPASVPLPGDRIPPRSPQLQVYVESDDLNAYFRPHPYELDPLPFGPFQSDTINSFNPLYQEC